MCPQRENARTNSTNRISLPRKVRFLFAKSANKKEIQTIFVRCRGRKWRTLFRCVDFVYKFSSCFREKEVEKDTSKVFEHLDELQLDILKTWTTSSGTCNRYYRYCNTCNTGSVFNAYVHRGKTNKKKVFLQSMT